MRFTGKFSGVRHDGPRGTRMCMCSVCHELFSGESTFVQHRMNGKITGHPGDYFLSDCQDPADKGMVLNPYGVWNRPKDGAGDGCHATQDGVQEASGTPDSGRLLEPGLAA